MKRVFTAKPVLAGCGTKKKSVASSERVDISEITKELKKKSRYLTVDRKYLDQVCDILDAEGIDYTFDRCKGGKECKFHLIYE